MSDSSLGHILVVTEYVIESQNSTGYFWSKIINKLQDSGRNVFVITSRSTDVFKKDSVVKKGIIGKVFEKLKISFDLSYMTLKKVNKNSIIFTGTNPFLFLCFIPIFKIFKKFKWYLLVHDVFPNNLLAAKIVGEWNVFYKILNFYFNWVYSSADRLICIGRDMKNVIDKKTNDEAKSFIVPAWVNENEVFPLKKDFSNLNVDNQILFQFFGNLGRVQGVPNLLKAIELVSVQNAAFVFIGDGAMLSDVEEFIKANPRKNVKYLGSLPQKDKNYGLSLCDVALVSLEPGMLGLGVPSKTYFSLAAGKPILAAVDAASEVGLMIEESPIGWRCDPGDPKQLASLIDRVCSNSNEILKMRPREVFLEKYTEKIILKKIEELF